MTPKEQIQVLWEYSQSAYLCTTISITRGDPTRFLDTNCGNISQEQEQEEQEVLGVLLQIIISTLGVLP